MRLRKTKAGRAKIFLFYMLSGLVVFILIILIMARVGFLAGLASGFALGIGVGVLGGMLEYAEHRRTPPGKILFKKRNKEQPKIIQFPAREKANQ